MFGSTRELVKKIASERIELLFSLAELKLKDDEALSKKYISTLRNISSHYKVSVPKSIRNKICTKCNSVLMPGLNSRVRIVSSHRYIAYVCNNCGREVHIRY